MVIRTPASNSPWSTNPLGPSLPPPQGALEADYKKLLGEEFGIRFNRLFTITNMPIKRFGAILAAKGQFDEYMNLLKNAYRADNLKAVMCRDLISVDYRGYLYDCDFNQMLELPLGNQREPRHLEQLLESGRVPEKDRRRRSLLWLHGRSGIELWWRARIVASRQHHISDQSAGLADHPVSIEAFHAFDHVERTILGFDENPGQVFPQNTDTDHLQAAEEQHQRGQRGITWHIHTVEQAYAARSSSHTTAPPGQRQSPDSPRPGAVRC